MSNIKPGTKVQVARIIPDDADPKSDDVGRQRLGQEGTVKYGYSSLSSYNLHVVFKTPDADGDFGMEFSEAELEVIP